MLCVMTEPRWLDAQEMRAWRGLLDMNRLLFEQINRELSRRSGLSSADYEVLVRLSEAPDRRLRMSELAIQSLSSKSRLSHQVSRLERQGWIRREDCPTDRRGAFATMTDAGYAVLEEAAKGHVQDVRRHLLDHLDAEQVRALGEITATLNGYLETVVERD
jgi:DNA-binding MarR family transcriptional regulator